MYICKLCSKVTYFVSDFISHFRRSHASLKNFECCIDGCSRNYTNIESLRYHLNKNHQKYIQPITINNTLDNLPIIINETNETLDSTIVQPNSNIIQENRNLLLADVNRINQTNISYDHDFRNSILKLIINVYNENSFSRHKILFFLNQNFEIFNSHVKFTINALERSEDINEELINFLKRLSRALIMPSEYMFFKYLFNEGLLTYPIAKNISKKERIVNKNQSTIVKSVTTNVYIINLTELFSKLFNKTNMLSDIIKEIERINNESGDFVCNFIQSDLWKEKLNNLDKDPDTLYLPLFIYFDDFEPNNVLGSRANKKN